MNFSFLLDGKNWKLSPAYDLTFSFGPGGEHSTTYMGEGKNPTIKHLQLLAKKHTIKEGDAIINEVRGVVQNFKNYAVNVGISKNSYEKIYAQL